MDFFEDLFDLGERKRRNNNDRYDKHNEHGHDDEYDDHDHHGSDHHDRDRGYYENNPRQGAFCTSCSTQASPGAKFCQNCGAVLKVALNCSSCGSGITANASFCTECGMKLK